MAAITLQTTSTIIIGLKMRVWFPVCPFIRGSFARTRLVWEHEACPLSEIKKVRSWEVVSVYLDSDFNPCHS